MARIKKPLFGHLHGQLGEYIYYEYRGVPCVRKKPTNSKPPSSPGQLAQQERMAAVAIFYQALKEVGIYAYWQKAAEGLRVTGHNLLVKANLPAFNGEGNICDFNKLQLTPGTLALPDHLSLQTAESGEWRATWSNADSHPGTQPDDRLGIALMKGDPENYEVELPDIGDFRRREGCANFRIPDRFKDYKKAWLFFMNENERKINKSTCFTF